MTPTEKDVDRLIREALCHDELDLYDRLGPPSVHEMVIDLFRGRNRWLSILNVVITLLFMVGAIWCAVRLFEAQENAAHAVVGDRVLLLCPLRGVHKIWTWMEMHRSMLSREIKRLELQVPTFRTSARQARAVSREPAGAAASGR